MAIEFNESIDNTSMDEKNRLIEDSYFDSGRLYELLKFIDSLEQIKNGEKYMLLKCSLVLKKNTYRSVITIIDDLLKNYSGNEKLYEEAGLLSLKIKVLCREMRMKEAYEIFNEHQDKIVAHLGSMNYCCDACYLIAFFLYNVDRDKSISVYKTATGIEVDDFMIGELYNPFSTMNIPPYVKARSIQKSIELMKKGKSDSFSRNMIAADILYELGEYTEAYDIYIKLLNNEKPDTVVMNKMAVCVMKQNKFDEAYKLFLKIISLTKFIPGAYSCIVRCCLELRYDWADYYKFIEIEKLSFSEIYELAGSLMSAEYNDKAGYLYSFMMEKYKNMDIYSKKMICHNLAWVYKNLKDYEKGIEIVKSIPEKYLSEDLLIDLGCLYHDNGQLDMSQEIFTEVLKNSNNPTVNFNMGIINMRSKRYDNALFYFNSSKQRITSEIRERKPSNTKEYSSMLSKLYKNMSLCLINLGKMGEAMSAIDMAGRINIDGKVLEITFIIQQQFLRMSKGTKEEVPEMEYLMDSCGSVKESFAEDIRRLLDNVLNKIYGEKRDNKFLLHFEYEESIAAFLKNERRIYTKFKDSTERSEGTFQRYIDNLIDSFEKKVIIDGMKEVAVSLDDTVQDKSIIEYSKRLVNIGDRLFENLEYSGHDEYMYASLVPYYKSIKILCRHLIYPYYRKNIDTLPAPMNTDEYKKIGVFSYKTGNEIFYRVDFPFNISCSEYLFEINCNPGLRNRYMDPEKHYMPWDKLLWIISGIKKKWDVLDDAKSAGLLLLFYGGFKNYLGIGENFKDRDEIIKLSGDLIHISNERDFCLRNMLKGEYEFDYINRIREVRDIALRCISGLLNIEKGY